MDEKGQLLKHFLAALSYRTQKVLCGGPKTFPTFRAAPGLRTPHEIIHHMSSILAYARTFFVGGESRFSMLESFDAEVRRFHQMLVELGHHIEVKTPPQDTSFERLLQGPFSDAMTHVGQLAMLRRLAGSPVAPENFLKAEVTPENLGPGQPMSPDAEWVDAEGPP